MFLPADDPQPQHLKWHLERIFQFCFHTTEFCLVSSLEFVCGWVWFNLGWILAKKRGLKGQETLIHTTKVHPDHLV